MLTLADPSTDPDPVASPVKVSVRAVCHAAAVLAFPVKAAVIVPAVKLPLLSRRTTAEAVLAEVAALATLTALSIAV